MLIVICEPNREPIATGIVDTLKQFQDIVGGYVEYVPFMGRADRMLVCNEEGTLLNLPTNRAVSIYYPPKLVPIVGTFFVAGYHRGAGSEASHLIGLTPEEAAEVIAELSKT